jgi:hypothetical protein
MYSVCKRLVQKYPNLGICVCGVGVMAAPAVLGATLLLISWYFERRGNTPLPVSEAELAILMTYISRPFQIVLWAVFAAGFFITMVGWFLAYRRRPLP